MQDSISNYTALGNTSYIENKEVDFKVYDRQSIGKPSFSLLQLDSVPGGGIFSLDTFEVDLKKYQVLKVKLPGAGYSESYWLFLKDFGCIWRSSINSPHASSAGYGYIYRIQKNALVDTLLGRVIWRPELYVQDYADLFQKHCLNPTNFFIFKPKLASHWEQYFDFLGRSQFSGDWKKRLTIKIIQPTK